MHTNYSDGVDSPTRVVERAVELGLAALAVTDHDSVGGLEEAQAAANEQGLEFLPGVEISAGFGHIWVHVVGLGIDAANEPLGAALSKLQAGRVTRAVQMIERLNELDVPVDFEKVRARTADGIIGRLHIAQEIEAIGFAKTVQGAFDRYIGVGRPAYVPKLRIPCEDAIALVHQADGLAVLGHPGLGGVKARLSTLLCLPFDGVEVYHSKHTPGETQAFAQVAAERGLLVSGGSDCHGNAKKQKAEMGTVRVPYECFQRIKEALGKDAGK
ncbi:MAG TPA: PHP domain-containing protein [Candidatus Hydrogenedentes bacterium]|nr:PHP domain-containing protein [Candidatus Hydrogenedentota bacterium]HIJ73747.1 PHP domain-containing protein [Candidatus Hydrogenedentota bacterium]